MPFTSQETAATRNKHGFGSQTWVSVPPMLLTRYVTLVVSLNLAKLRFLQ